MTRDEYALLLEKVNNKMLFIKNESIEETCPIGIIDFNKWEWPQGIGLYGMYQYYKRTGNKTYLDYIISWFDARMEEGIPTRNVNTTAPMLTLAFVAEETGNQKYLSLCQDWAQWVMTEMPRTEEGGLQHIVSGEENRQQLWDDTLFMTVLFLAKMGVMLNKKEYQQEAVYQFLLHARYLEDRKTGLWFHGWCFEGRHNFAQALWARGNCWITAGIPELLEIMEPEPADRRFLIRILNTQVEALAKLQADSGLWHTLLDDPASYEESSAAAGFAYGILKGIHTGILPDRFQSVADKAVEGVLRHIDQDGTVGQVSYGTGMGRSLDHYREIPLCPMAYGQSLTVMMLAEALG